MLRRMWSRTLVLLTSALSLSIAVPVKAGSCDSLMKLTLANTTITSAQLVGPGGFRLPPGGRAPSVELFSAFNRLPSFCRVQAEVTPARDSHIEVEVWLPESNWNGKYLGVGNGGFAGSLNYFRLGEALNSGYVTASTDTGHQGGDREWQWSLGHPERAIDFDYRAIHETSVVAKAAIQLFYGRKPDHSYFSSCSNGGRQGLMEAQRYPADYDGIMAGAPAMSLGFKTYVSDGLDAFRRRKGKLVIYHGGNDDPQRTMNYYTRLLSRMGQRNVDGFMKLYIVPGMAHCGGGSVPNDLGQWLRPDADPRHSLYKALERWVENGVPPKSIIATQYNTDGDRSSGILRTRPICPYPEEARWKGEGNQDDAVNYVCGAPR